MKISELSKLTGVSIRSIRHYESKNLLASARLDNGYRDFDESAIERIRTIQLYLGLGLNTDQIEEVLACIDINPQYAIDEYCEDMVETYEEKLDEVNRQMKSLGALKQRLEKQISQFKGNQTTIGM